MLKRPLQKREYVLLGLFVLTALAPLAVDLAAGRTVKILPTALLLQDVGITKEEWMNTRRTSGEVRDRCRDVTAADADATCPDVNKPSAVRAFLLGAAEEDAVVEEATSDALTLSDLTRYELALVRRAQRRGECPDSLENVRDGLQGLCQSSLQKEIQPIQGLLSPEALRGQQSSRATLEDRIETFEGMRPDR